MSEPAKLDLKIVRGNTFQREFRFLTSRNPRTPADITGSTIRFFARRPDGLAMPLDLTITDGAAGVATLSLTTIQTRWFPVGSVTPFEIERRIGGTQTTLVMGRITGIGGLNDD